MYVAQRVSNQDSFLNLSDFELFFNLQPQCLRSRSSMAKKKSANSAKAAKKAKAAQKVERTTKKKLGKQKKVVDDDDSDDDLEGILEKVASISVLWDLVEQTGSPSFASNGKRRTKLLRSLQMVLRLAALMLRSLLARTETICGASGANSSARTGRRCVDLDCSF